MPATRTLIPGATKLLQGASYIGGVAPADGDSILIKEGSQVIESIDMVAASVGLAELIIGPMAAVTLGDAAGPVKANVTTVTYAGRGGGAKLAGTHGTIIANGQAGQITLSAGTATTIYCSGPHVIDVNQDYDLATVMCLHSDGAVVAQKSSKGTPDRCAALTVVKGAAVFYRDVEAAVVGGGRLRMADAAAFNNGAGGGSLKLYAGEVAYDSGVTIPSADLLGGVFDPRGSANNVTISAGVVGSGCRVRRSWGGAFVLNISGMTQAGGVSDLGSGD